jgi:SAM-dependent methyltransferase
MADPTLVSPPTPTAYDFVDYPSMSHPQTFAENLAIKGWLRGLDVTPPHRARVLELGCGDGFNLALMATLYPEGTYVGLDYADEAVQRGRSMLGELGMDQVKLATADIRALPEGLGEFDYILAHGVYSWVPEDVRNALLQAIRRHLAPQGVAFVSYLALPGAYMREMVRTMMRFHVQKETAPETRTRQARALLHLLSNATTETNAYTNWLKAETKVIEAHHDAAFYHDELSEVSAPLLFTDFLAQAARHELHFLGEAEYMVSIVPSMTPETRQHLRPLENNRVLLEQYLDFIEGRRFRQTLVCREAGERALRLDRLDSLHIGFAGKPSGPVGELQDEAPLEFVAAKASVMARVPFEKALLLELIGRTGVAPFPEIEAAARARLQQAGLDPGPEFSQKLRHFTIRAAVPGLVELRWRPTPRAYTVPVRPRAHPIALWQLAREQETVAAIDGNFVAINGKLGQYLLSLLDGTRDRPALLEAVRNFLASHHQTAAAEGTQPTLPPPDLPELSEQLERSLQGLTNLGLLYRE